MYHQLQIAISSNPTRSSTKYTVVAITEAGWMSNTLPISLPRAFYYQLSHDILETLAHNNSIRIFRLSFSLFTRRY